jgi:hypothetical protein
MIIFVWWFGVVENRMDPLELGRCQVRCFGWHTEDINQIPIEELPWAQPVVPYGVKSVQPPSEGTMVFGFFADGKEALYPIILGTVPGIPQELRESNQGFADPYTDAEKNSSQFPRKVKQALTPINNRGVQVTDANAKRYPGMVNLNEPTLSRLARPLRNETATGFFIGIVPSSIANTTIDIQRKNRVANVKSASSDKYKWNEPFPSFAAKYPFNHVTETESGHAFEMDDTQGFERVQLSHRVGSTLEFMSEGDVKLKSMKNKYDITMGNKYEYINGKRDETIQSDMYLRVNGKLIIQCNGLQIASAGDIDMKGQNVRITGVNKLNLYGAEVGISGVKTSIVGATDFNAFGGTQCRISSGSLLSLSASIVKTSALSTFTEAIMINTQGIHNLFTPLPAPPDYTEPSKPAKSSRAKVATPVLSPVSANSNRKPKTDRYGRQEQLKTELDPKAAKAQAAAIEAAKNKTVTANDSILKDVVIPATTFSFSSTIDANTGAISSVTKFTDVTVNLDSSNPVQVGSTSTTSSKISPAPETSSQKSAGTISTPSTVPDYSTSNTVVTGG